MKFSVKQKIVISLWLVTFLMLSLAGILASVWFINDQSSRLDAFLSNETRAFQGLVSAFASVNDRKGNYLAARSPEFMGFLSDYVRTRLNSPLPYKTSFGVFDTDGNLVQESNEAFNLAVPGADTADELWIATAGPPTYRVAVLPLSYDGQRLGSVRIACLTETLGDAWDSFLASMSVVLAGIFVAFGALATLLIHWSLRPVRLLSLSAQSISELRLDRRLAVPAGRDEIAVMAHTMNTFLERMERDFRFEEALVGQISNQLRTPLTILRGRNELAIDRKPSPYIKRVLEDNLADLDNIVSLLNTLLNLARLDGRLEPVAIEPFDLVAVICDLIDELDPLWEEKQIHFEFSLAGKNSIDGAPPLLAVGDALMLRQVFLNLLTNAYKYTPAWGGIGVSVDAAGSTESPTWRIVVRNPGPSIPDEALEMVFKRFYRVEVQHPERYERASGLEQPGFGLGLSVAKSMVELQNGRIRAFNPESGGAAFEVMLPRRTTEKRRRVP